MSDKITITLDKYERDNLRQALRLIGHVNHRVREFGALDTGDWVMQIHHKLGSEENDGPNRSDADVAEIAKYPAIIERERVKQLLAPYAWHAYNCPKMNDHACTCGMEAVRIELWGKSSRPAPEPFVKPHESYAKPPKKRLDYEKKRNKT